MSLDNIPYCDVFYPSEDEFKIFDKYIEKCERTATSGIIKVFYLITYFKISLGNSTKIVESKKR